MVLEAEVDSVEAVAEASITQELALNVLNAIDLDIIRMSVMNMTKINNTKNQKEEEMLLMAGEDCTRKETICILDSSSSNHMGGYEDMFHSLRRQYSLCEAWQ